MGETRWLPIRYREFHDVPRTFVVSVAEGQLLFDCAFDHEIGEYPDVYRVYRLPREVAIPAIGSWQHLPASGRFLTEIPVRSVRFDATRRASIDGGVIDGL